MKYLYGASVQGIQKFIFETNKLKEIIGASELVEQISTEKYKEFIKEKNVETIISAAGNIKLMTDEKKNFEKIVREFPKAVQNFAPGITISQAVVETGTDEIIKDDFDELERRLKFQRNKPYRPSELSFLAIERSRRTGKSAVGRDRKDGKLVDKATLQKRNQIIDKNDKEKVSDANSRLIKKILGENIESERIKQFPFDMADIVREDQSKWLAVIHADGNSLGKIIQQLFKEGNIFKTYKNFSTNLDKATIIAASTAFKTVILEPIAQKKIKIKNNKFPFRPIVIGGDDLTVICRADLAIDFTKAFLTNFENETKKKFKDFKNIDKLTACAGIAFVKEKFPFHYAVHLAEELCAVAKKKSKDINDDDVPASIAFHKIQSSFVDSYEEIKKRELFAKVSQVKFNYGPYFLSKRETEEDLHQPLIEKLKIKVKILNRDDSPKSGIRKWLSELHKDKNSSKQLMNRIIQISKEKEFDFVKKLGLESSIENVNFKDKENNNIIKSEAKTPFYDLLTILSIGGGEK